MQPSSLQKKLIIVYSPWKKLLALLGLGFMLCLAWLGLLSNFFILEATLVLAAAYVTRVLIDVLTTRSIGFYPDKIVKTTYFGQTTIPTQALVVVVREPVEQYFHGSDSNKRESIKVAAWYVSTELKLWLDSYRRNVYGIGAYMAKPLSANNAACVEFERAVASFRFMRVLTAVYLLVYVIYATCLYWQYPVFNGYAPNWPAVPIRLLAAGLALAAYPLLRGLAAAEPSAPGVSYTAKVQRAQQLAFRSALAAHGVAWLGLPLFLLFGNKLDFYILLLLGAAYHNDFYPRLSDWEKLLQAGDAADASQRMAIPRRSLQVSLALLGGLSLAGFAGNPDDFRIRQQDCRDDNGNPVECHSGGSHGGGSGSSYRGAGGAESRSPARRGGFGFFGGSHGSFGG